MTTRSRYLKGLAGIAGLTLIASLALGPEERGPLLLALALAAVVQAPLGWWLIRAVGTHRFMLAWAVGLGARLLLLGAMGLVGVPLLDVAPAALLMPLAGLLVALLALEGVVVVMAQQEARAL